MRISFDPSQRITPSFSNQEAKRTARGIADAPSSLELQLRSNESSGGFCDWIQSIIDRICQLFGISSSNTSTERSDRDLLEQRVATIKEIISEHFQKDQIRLANPNSVIIVVMKCNNQSDIDFGLATVVRDNQNAIKCLARQLLEREPHDPRNMNFKIDTIVLDWNSNSYFHQGDWASFAGRQGGTAHGDITTHARTLLNRVITDHGDRTRLMSFLSRWSAFGF